MAINPSPNPEFEKPGGFPEPDADDDDDLQIEVLDDTPVEDARPARPAAERIDLDSEAFEQEIQDYSENAQQRIQAVKFEFHEERRAKEAAERRAAEATRYAEATARDNHALKQSLESSNTVLVEQYGARSDAELEKARADYRDAYEGGDTDALLKAQEEMSRLHAERAGPLARLPAAVAAPAAAAPAPAAPAPDTRAMKWIRENPWFHATGFEDMTGYAVGLHEKLIKGGFNPQIHEEYYTQIDEGLRAVFPDKFSNPDLGGKEVDLPPAVTGGKKKPPVGGPTRGGNPPRKVQLTTTQVALAKRLGLTNKQYAAQVVKEQMADG